jgi:hypothetical protein
MKPMWQIWSDNGLYWKSEHFLRGIRESQYRSKGIFLG